MIGRTSQTYWNRILLATTNEKDIREKGGSSSGLRLDGKVAVITGAASGIGAATARLFVTHGAKVVIADIRAEAGKKLSSELGSYAHYFHCDVTKEADVAGAVDYAVSSWGGLDIMFNNASVAGPLAGLADIDINEFDTAMAVNVKGSVLGVKHAARVMAPAGKGVILFSGSTSSEMGGSGPPLYSATKAAILSIMRSAAAELGRHGIRVNAVSPHCVATPMSIATFKASMNTKTDLTVEQFEKLLAASSDLAGQVLTVDQVASAALFLASDEAVYVSGHNLVLDGGFSTTKHYNSSSLKAAMQKVVAAERRAEAESGEHEREAKVNSSAEARASSVRKEREQEDKAKEKEEKLREKEEKAAQKKAREQDKQREKEEKEREKREKEQLRREDRARAKEEKREKKLQKENSKDGNNPEQINIAKNLSWGLDPTKQDAKPADPAKKSSS